MFTSTARLWKAALAFVTCLSISCIALPRCCADDRRPDKTTLTLMALNCEFMWDGIAPEEGDKSITFAWKGNQALAEAHMKQIANLILRANPDVVSMEEVENAHALSVLNDKFLTGRGYKPFFIQGKDTFTGQDVALLSRIDLDDPISRDDREGKSGAVTSLVSKNYYAHLTVGSMKLALIGLHLIAIPTDPKRVLKREAQANAIHTLALEQQAQGRQVIILGDLNDWDGDALSRDAKDDRPTSNVLATLRGMNPADPKDDLVNAASLMPKEDRYTDFYDENNNNKVDAPQEFSMIDHILLAPALAAQVEDAFVPHEEDPLTVSDHFPVVVRLRLAPSVSGMTNSPAPGTVTPAAPPPTPPLPVAAVRPVIDTYFGQQVIDPYRWMEKTSDPEVKDWFKGQSDYSRAVLDAVPGHANLLAEIEALDAKSESVGGVQIGGNRFFYLKTPPTSNNDRLYVRDGLYGRERVLLDPETLTKGGVHSSIDYYVASLDGRYVAYAVSPGGSEDSVLHILNVATGKQTGETIDRTQFGGVSWRADNASFFYNRLQKLAPGADSIERYKKSRVYLHRVGTDAAQDVPVLGFGLSKRVLMGENDTPAIEVSLSSPYVFGVIGHGVQNEITLYAAPLAALSGAKTPWRKIADVADDVTSFDARGDTLYLLSHKGASRYKVLATSLAHPDLAHARTIVPPGSVVVTGLGVAADALYVTDLDGGVSHIRRVPFAGGAPSRIVLPYTGSMAGLVIYPTRPGLLFAETGWTHSLLWYAYDAKTGLITDTGLKRLSPISFAGITSVEVKARAADGTLVPLSIVYKKGQVLDGTHPTLLEGYGAYGLSPYTPGFHPTSLPWMEQGGVLAYAHVRGGGEYGEDWHLGGKKLKKHNTWEDFIACGQYLVDHKYTSPAHLAGEGGSAGGITVGRALTERPDLFAAIISSVGVSDPLRSELSPNGPPNIPEFGSFTTPDGFKGLYAMDAYQHVVDGTHYPAVLLTTGINDPRVSSWEPAKMTARLQAATAGVAGAKPVLLRVDYDAGHGIGSTKHQGDLQEADEDAFLLWQLGNPNFQPPATP